MCDPSWICAKIHCTGCVGFLEDTYLCNVAELNHVKALRQIITDNFTSLNYDASQLYGILHHYVNDTENLEKQGLDPKVKKLWIDYIQREEIWLEARNHEINIEDVNVSDSCDVVLNIDTKGYYIVALSKKREEITVWDVKR